MKLSRLRTLLQWAADIVGGNQCGCNGMAVSANILGIEHVNVKAGCPLDVIVNAGEVRRSFLSAKISVL